MARSLELYDVPYPSRDREDIVSLIWAKKEFRECKAESKVVNEIRVSPIYYNIQVFYQRYMTAYRSVLLYFKQSCGKTGAYKCFQSYMRQFQPGSVSKFYYFCGKSQINDFNEQVTIQFGDDQIREAFEKASSKARNGQDIVKRIHNERARLVRNKLKAEKIASMTYGKFSKIVNAMNNETVIKTFANASLFIDEVQFIKLDEDKDKKIVRDKDEAKQSRKRVQIYNAFYRVARLCPDCYVTVSTGTPNTNNINDIIYQINLLPGDDALVWTAVSERIADEMYQKYGILPPRRWNKLDLENTTQEELEEQMEELLRGRVMYATAPETDALKSYMTDETVKKLGDRFPFSPAAISRAIKDHGASFKILRDYDYEKWRDVSYDEQCHRTLATYTMSEFQSRQYLKFHDTVENVHSSARHASIFIFPSDKYAKICAAEGIEAANEATADDKDAGGLIGIKAFEHYCELKKVVLKEATGTTSYTQRVVRTIDTYKATKSFARYVSDFNNIKNSGIKIYEIIMNALNPNVGPMTVASTLVHLTCVLIGVILKVHGFEEYSPEKKNIYRQGNLSTSTKGMRYALLGADNKSVHQEILRLAGHKDNVRGEYLKLVLITPVSSTGLNIHQQEVLWILDPPFTPAQLEQSERRVLRPNSHQNSFEWAQQHWGIDNFPLYVYYMVAEPDADLAADVGVDPQENREWAIYASGAQKDKKNARIMRALKRIAVDAPANLDRNITAAMEDYSPEADYIEAAYEPYRLDRSLPLDTTTYDSYYAAKSLDIPRHQILSYFMSLPAHTASSIQDLVKAFGDKYTEVELTMYLKTMVEEQTVTGTDAFGLNVVLNENSGVFYLSREIMRISDPSLEYYSNFLPLQSSRPLESVMYDFLDPEKLENYKLDIEEAENHRDYISEYIPNAYKTKLLEDAFIAVYSTPTVPIASLRVWMRRMLIALFNLNIQLVTESGPVVVHQVNSIFNGEGSGTNYNPVDSVLRASQQLRIMNIKQGLVWTDCTKPEAELYSRMLNSRFSADLDAMYHKFADVGCIGIIVRYDAVHIRRFDVTDGLVENRGTGKNSSGFKLKSLLPLMYKASIYNTDIAYDSDIDMLRSGRTLVDSVYEGMERLNKEPIGKAVLMRASTEELNYYLDVLYRIKTDSEYSPARHLCQMLYKIGAIYTVLGEPKLTIARIGRS
ncbi:VV D6-like helicase [uncultured virus]|nr:VV D6-like helicase [uncultured virus]